MRFSCSGVSAPCFSGRVLMQTMVLLAACLTATPVYAQLATTDAAVAARLSADLKLLSSDEYGGRGPHTAGINLAADYIAKEFKAAGLQTNLYSGKPFQEFMAQEKFKPGKNNNAALTIAGQKPQQLKMGEEFTSISLSNSAKFSGGLVFAGYGITAPEFNYDDYAGLDVRGKVVVVLRHEPRQNDKKSVFNGNRNSEHAFVATKIKNAIAHGAAAIVFCTDHVTFKARQATLGDKPGADALFGFEVRGKVERKLPVIHIKRAQIDAALAAAGQPSLAALESSIDTGMKPQSQPIKGATLQGETSVENVRDALKNVIGVLPGRGALADETLVFGAHYDHLGRGGGGSLAPWTKEIHNGADDNGSGTVALMEIARQITRRRPANHRRMVFIAFSGEEIGLVGSAKYVKQPLFPLAGTVAMLNLDMVGRLTKDRLYLYGTGTATEFPALALRHAEKFGISLQPRSSGNGPSDHASFHRVGIPVMHFFTGLHDQYHRPSDDFELVNIDGIRRIAMMAASTGLEIATAEKRPEARRTTGGIGRLPVAGDRPANNRPAGAGRPWVGVSVQPSAEPRGLTITRIMPNSPAAAAQLRAGDILLSAAKKPLTSIDDLKSQLAGKKDGDKLPVNISRGGAQLEISVTLRTR